jgi:hypothetical protein
MSSPHGWARRNKQDHTKGVELLLDEHTKINIQLFMKGEMKGEKKSAALMLVHLISIASEIGLKMKVSRPRLKVRETPRVVVG